MSGTSGVEETLRNRHLRLINGLCLDMKTLNEKTGLTDTEKLQAYVELADKISTSFDVLKSLDPAHFGEGKTAELEPEKFSSILKKKSGKLQCFGCGTMDTPEWRKGPCGPRTLCNACGLVYAKIVRRDKEEKNKVGDSAAEEQKMVKIMAEVIAISSMKQKKGRVAQGDFISVDPSKVKKQKKDKDSPSASSTPLSSSSSSSSEPYHLKRPSSPPPVFKISSAEDAPVVSLDDLPPIPHSNAFLYSSQVTSSGLVMNTKWIKQQAPLVAPEGVKDDEEVSRDLKRTSLSFLLN